MKLRLGQVVHYNMGQMVYRLGKRARFYKLRHFSLRGRLAVGAVGTLTLALSYVPAQHISPALKLGGVHPTANHVLSKANPTRQAAGSSRQPPKSVTPDKAKTPPPVAQATLASGCAAFPAMTPGLANAATSELRKVAAYETICSGRLGDRSSFFAPTPSTTAQAADYAGDMVASLRTYAQYGITPVIFMEPATGDGTKLDLGQYRNGAYDAALDAYFASIKAAGITDSMMGLWVMLPEGNIPVWTSVDPATFAADVTKVASYQKKYFPVSQAGIMLDSQTYPSASSWSGGAYVSLSPYVQGIPAGLLDSMGLQGFPWAAPAGQAGSLYDPTVYLHIDLLAQAANQLGIRKVWFNTGTFSQAYAGSSSRVAIDVNARRTMLAGVLSQAQKLKNQGFAVSLHIFAQDKSQTSEAIDWSYGVGVPGRADETALFRDFASSAYAAGFPLWLFDVQ